MTNNGSRQQVARILYREIKEGDLRKIVAQSNDSDSGGGARDFRFRPYDQLEPIIRAMFPDTVLEDRRRNKRPTQVGIHKGKFCWHDSNGNVVCADAFMEPPTSARPNEGRIPRVHELACFDTSRIPSKGGSGNMIILLLIQRADGTVWPHYVDERSLRTPGAWDKAVSDSLIACIDANRSESTAMIGSYDFTTRKSFCNGK